MNWNAIAAVVGGLGVIVTFAIFVGQTIYKQGQLEGEMHVRVGALELWRGNIRDDMHEISDAMARLSNEVVRLAAVIQERTERAPRRSTDG